MSKTHPYRIQLHCSKQMHKDLNHFAEQRGLSQSAAARILVERALAAKSDEISYRLDEIHRTIYSVLHASAVSRILAAEIAQYSGSKLSGDELKERVSRLLQRYKSFESS